MAAIAVVLSFLLAAASAAPVSPPICAALVPTPLELRYRWMGEVLQPVGNAVNAALNTLLFPGSHDAGCQKGETTGTMKGWAETQQFNIGEQMCHGWRFFDIRFKQKNAVYTIHHGGYWFKTMAQTFADIASYVNHASVKYEVLFLRIKLESGTTAEKQGVYNAAVAAFNTGGKTCIVPRADNNDLVFATKTLQQVWNNDNCAKIFLIDYNDEAVAPIANLNVWNYGGNILGKASKEHKFRKQAKKQLGKIGRVDAGNAMTAYWTNTYSYNIWNVGARWRDGGKYAGWSEWVIKTVPNNKRLNFLVTDWAGLESDVTRTCRTASLNVVNNANRDTGFAIPNNFANIGTTWADRNQNHGWDATFVEKSESRRPIVGNSATREVKRILHAFRAQRYHQHRFPTKTELKGDVATDKVQAAVDAGLKSPVTKCTLCSEEDTVAKKAGCCVTCELGPTETDQMSLADLTKFGKDNSCCFVIEEDQLKTKMGKTSPSADELKATGAC